jgi:hypothetical protein
MKILSISVFLAIFCLLAFIPEKAAKISPRDSQGSSPFVEGAWEMYSTESEGITTYHKKPKQITVYTDNYMCQIHYTEEGKFEFAAGGIYELEGNIIKSKAMYHTYEPGIGAIMWWECSKSANGDTLYFSGPLKVVMADGSDITKAMKQKVEKKVRVKM